MKSDGNCCLAYCLPQLPHHAPGVSEARSLALLVPFEARPVDPVRREVFRQLAETSGTASTSGWVAPSATLPTTPPPLERSTEKSASRTLPSKSKGKRKRSSKAHGC